VASFVGREREVGQLVALMRERSLVTLTGAGGVGKTRLALRVAVDVGADFRDGAWVWELAPVSDADVLWESLAASLAIRPSRGATVQDGVLDYLALKRLLLVCDNCEHLVVPVAGVVEAIGQSCPEVAVLATSREGLALAGEQLVAVSPLSVPSTGDDFDALLRNDAVRLFCDRGRQVDAAFELTDRNAAAVAELCRRLDGLPLAIEIVAARVRSVPPQELVAELHDRFRSLSNRNRSAPERHQTLRNTFDWSYDRLTHTQQLALNRMSVFAGGCDLASAEVVLAGGDIAPGDIGELLSQLVDKSLVEVDTSEERGRYRLLETIRQFAQDRLEVRGETEVVRRRHLVRYVALAEEAGPYLRSPDQLGWAAALGCDADNFRVALSCAVDGELADEGLRLVASLVSGCPLPWVGTDWPDTVIAIPGASRHPLYPVAAAHAAIVAAQRAQLGDAAIFAAAARDAQARLRTQHRQVRFAGAVVALLQGEFDQAQQHASRCAELARIAHDPFELASALTLYAAAFPNTLDGVPRAEEAVHVARDAGIPSTYLYALAVLIPCLVHEQPARAQTLIDDYEDVARRLGDRQASAMAYTYRSGVAAVQGDWHTALHAATQAAEAHLEFGGSLDLGAALTMAAMALAHLGRADAAAILAGVIEHRYPPIAVDDQWRRQITAADQLILETLGAPRTAEQKTHGATLTITAAVAFLRTQHDDTIERPALPAGLTDREVQVLHLLAHGKTTKEIGRALFISPSTVHTHTRHIYEKIGVTTRAAAALYAIQHDLLQTESPRS
jgi:predicted ATPase/DNA-binding CsgD family transcriptional regulator